MSKDNLPATQVSPEVMAEKIGVPATIIKDLTPTQQGWIALCKNKETTFKQLQEKELAVQGHLQGITAMKDLVTVQDKLKKAKEVADEAKDQRLNFTNILKTKIVEPAMEFEKRNEILIKSAEAHELTLRLAAEKEHKEKESQVGELEQFKAHTKNEWFRIAADYRLELDKYINMQYIGALEQKLPKKSIAPLIRSIKQTLEGYKKSPMNKFAAVNLTKAEMEKAYKEIPKYTGKEDLEAAFKKLDEKFAMYDEDLKNAAAAIEATKQQQAQTEEATKDSLEIETSTNNLVAQSGVNVGTAPKVKREFKVVIEDTEIWAMGIIAHSMKNWQTIKQYFKVKSWEKLSIGQMADALGKHITATQTQIPGIKTLEQTK